MFVKSQWNKIEIQISYNLQAKPLNKLRLIYEQFVYVLYLDLVVYMSLSWIDFDWLIGSNLKEWLLYTCITYY